MIAILLGSLVVLLGVVLIAIGEILDWGWTRIVGAGAISTAAVYVGALVGWSDPLRPQIMKALSSWSRVLLVLLTLIMVAPLLAGLLMLVGGAIIGGISASWYMVFIGLLLALFLTVIITGSVVVAFSLADRGLWRVSSDPDDSQPEESAT